MANQNNLIRPPVLNNPPQPQPQNVVIPDQEVNIANIVRRILLEERSSHNETEHRSVDQGIERNNDLTDLDKIPDVVRSLREFSGNKTEFSSWKKSTERILKIYEPLRGTAKYFGILNVIRNKIVGDADIALESYNTPLNWKSIIKCLTVHYADQRDLGTLEYQLISMIQGNSSVQDFYKRIYGHLSLILNKIACLEESEDAIYLLTKNYRNKALDTFVRGLRGDLPRLLGIREPKDLHEALHLCLKLDNQQFRTQQANCTNKIPPIPHRKFNNTYQNQQFYPQLAHIPQPNIPIMPNANQQRYNTHQRITQGHQPHNAYGQNFPYRQNFQNPYGQNYNRNYTYPQQNLPPPRPNYPKPPVPMEIDSSIQTKKVNYINRPFPDNKFVGVRPLPQSAQFNQPRKLQRINHIEQAQYDTIPDTDHETHTNEFQQEDDGLQDLTEYLDEHFNISEENEHFNTSDENGHTKFSDIHFLD